MLVGQQFGPFTIDKELGSGAMGTVYRGRYTKTGQIMAIKVMAPGFGTTNAAAADRFEREITILKQLNHPNIVRLFGAGKQHGARYFAMEYIEGESLDRVMARRGRMTWEEVVALGQQLCAALQHAHEKGIIHRDLKPSNIMVLADGTLKLTDFGIAKDTDMDALTATNCTVGTAAYMSPEQCKGQSDLTHKSDLYSLGILFYELLTGKKPFNADNAMEMFVQHVQGTFERPSRMVLEIPVWLDTLICQLLEKKPEQRPFDANMVAQTLGGIQEKVAAQQSAGVEAVRRRFIDRTPGQKKPDEEDKEAARVLLTGKGKGKRKRVKAQWYEKSWVRGIGLLVLLAGAVALLWLAFRPPSAETLYQRAEKLMKSGQEEKAYEEPIQEYLKRYSKRPGPQTEQIRAWAEAYEVKLSEEKLRILRKRKRQKLPYPPLEGQGEEQPFAAAEAEGAGELDKARSLWQEVEKEGSPRWRRVAQNHLRMLEEVKHQDEVFKQIHAEMRKTLVEPALDAIPARAFLAWRAAYRKDRRLASALTKVLKDDLQENADLYAWYLYTAAKTKALAAELAKTPQEKPEAVKHLWEMFEEEAKKPFQEKKDLPDVLVLCLDVIALYEKDEEKSVKEIVEQARSIRDQIGGAAKKT